MVFSERPMKAWRAAALVAAVEFADRNEVKIDANGNRDNHDHWNRIPGGREETPILATLNSRKAWPAAPAITRALAGCAPDQTGGILFRDP